MAPLYPAAPQMPAAPLYPQVPAAPQSQPVPAAPPVQDLAVLPPMNAPQAAPNVPVLPSPAAAPSSDGTQMTLISPSGTEEGEEGTSWAVVLGIALVGEIALLWVAACLGVLRRRLVLAQTLRAAEAAGGGERRGARPFAALARRLTRRRNA